MAAGRMRRALALLLLAARGSTSLTSWQHSSAVHRCRPRRIGSAHCFAATSQQEDEEQRSQRLARARERHALTERALVSPEAATLAPPSTAASTSSASDTLQQVLARPGARVVGERPWASSSTRHSDGLELPWEPMAPPPAKTSFGLASSNNGFFAVFGLLAVYAFAGWILYAGGVAAIALAASELWRQLVDIV